VCAPRQGNLQGADLQRGVAEVAVFERAVVLLVAELLLRQHRHFAQLVQSTCAVPKQPDDPRPRAPPQTAKQARARKLFFPAAFPTDRHTDQTERLVFVGCSRRPLLPSRSSHAARCWIDGGSNAPSRNFSSTSLSLCLYLVSLTCVWHMNIPTNPRQQNAMATLCSKPQVPPQPRRRHHHHSHHHSHPHSPP
jgi:hypothetical protein